MRLTFLLLFLAACSSSSGLIETETIDCAESGNPVSVALYDAVVEPSPVSATMTSEPAVTLHLEVANNSHEEIVVKRIIIRQSQPGARFQINGSTGGFDETIPPGKEHVFELHTTGHWTNARSFSEDDVTTSVELEARVALENGTTYRCGFSTPLLSSR